MGSFDGSGFARHVECLQQHVTGFHVPLAFPQPLIEIAGKGAGQRVEQSNEIGIEFHDFPEVVEIPWRKPHPRWSDPRRTKGSSRKRFVLRGNFPEQYCKLQTERVNDRTADDPARNAA